MGNLQVIIGVKELSGVFDMRRLTTDESPSKPVKGWRKSASIQVENILIDVL